MTAILVLNRQRQGNQEFKASSGYIRSPRSVSTIGDSILKTKQNNCKAKNNNIVNAIIFPLEVKSLSQNALSARVSPCQCGSQVGTLEQVRQSSHKQVPVFGTLLKVFHLVFTICLQKKVLLCPRGSKN